MVQQNLDSPVSAADRTGNDVTFNGLMSLVPSASEASSLRSSSHRLIAPGTGLAGLALEPVQVAYKPAPNLLEGSYGERTQS
jgi:hypothetical protein